MMKSIGVAFLSASILFLAGCSTPSAIHLKDGSTIESLDTPEFDEDTGFYEYEAVDGSDKEINKDVIKSIEPLN